MPDSTREVTSRVIHAFFAVYNEIGFGFLESVYESAMQIELRLDGLEVDRQAPASVYYRGQLAGEFRADLIVAQSVVVELKTARAITPPHEAQLLNYLRSTPMEVGLLLNFGPRPTFRRLVYSNERKRGSVLPPL